MKQKHVLCICAYICRWTHGFKKHTPCFHVHWLYLILCPDSPGHLVLTRCQREFISLCFLEMRSNNTSLSIKEISAQRWTKWVKYYLKCISKSVFLIVTLLECQCGVWHQKSVFTFKLNTCTYGPDFVTSHVLLKANHGPVHSITCVQHVLCWNFLQCT